MKFGMNYEMLTKASLLTKASYMYVVLYICVLERHGKVTCISCITSGVSTPAWLAV